MGKQARTCQLCISALLQGHSSPPPQLHTPQYPSHLVAVRLGQPCGQYAPALRVLWPCLRQMAGLTVRTPHTLRPSEPTGRQQGAPSRPGEGTLHPGRAAAGWAPTLARSEAALWTGGAQLPPLAPEESPTPASWVLPWQQGRRSSPTLARPLLPCQESPLHPPELEKLIPCPFPLP